jgi:hypothetical protein
MIVKMITHMPMVVYTWWCWHICKGFERKRKVETPSPSYQACSTGFNKETEAKQVTGGDQTLASGAPARLIVFWCAPDVEHRTLAIIVDHPVMLTW